MKTSGLYDGSPKSVQVHFPDQLVADPHHIISPAKIFYVHGLTGLQYQKLIGEFFPKTIFITAEPKFNRMYLGRLAITSIITRPTVGLEIHAQREREFGRFENQNLLTLAWAENYFSISNETNLETFHELYHFLTNRNIYS